MGQANKASVAAFSLSLGIINTKRAILQKRDDAS
jgi:hypothetical protein